MSALSASLAAALVFLAAAPAGAAPAEQDAIRSGCLASLNWDAAMCGCMAEEAGRLSDDQQAFVGASLNDREAETEALRSRMPVADSLEAGMFLVKIGRTCHGG